LAPDPDEEYFIYQTLVGAWPFDADAVAGASFRSRMQAYMRKVLREAKVHTSWVNPNDEYETAVSRFVAAILDPRRSAAFLQLFAPLQARAAELGIYNSLAQLAIKLTAPGVPDFYQGSEFWDLTLVDPDNRRPVDYDIRRQALAGLKGCATRTVDPVELLDHRHDGSVKMFVTARGLCARAECRDLYERGDYVPLTVSGARRDSVFAFPP